MLDRIVTALNGVELQLAPAEHPFHVAHRAEAAENWRREKDRQPALFDGQVMLARNVAIDDGVLRADCRLVPFSTFMYWRTKRPVADAVHVFAMAVPIGSDGGVVVSEMSAGTANAGLVYCASGSFDPDDLVEGRFNPARNMVREVAEETGLDLTSAVGETGWHAVLVDGAVTVFRAFRFAESSEELVRLAAAHIARQREPELADVFAVHRRTEMTTRFANHMPVILNRYLAD